MEGGGFVVTEINRDWADGITPSGRVLWSTHPPGAAYPSDTNQLGGSHMITADYSDPGQVVDFTTRGKLLWLH